MTEQFEAELIACLEALEANQPIDSILARYPQDAPALRQALAVAHALPALDLGPDEAAQAEARQAFLAQAESLARGMTPPALGAIWLALKAVGVLTVVVAAGAVPIAASASALPGEPLYGLKRGVEDVRILLAPSADERKALTTRLNQERLNETHELVQNKQAAQTQFEGRLESIQPGMIQVSGLSIAVPAGMTLPKLTQGIEVQVSVRVEDGKVILLTVAPLESEATGATPEITTTPPATVEPQPEETRQVTAAPKSEGETPEVKATESTHEGETPQAESTKAGESSSTQEPKSSQEVSTPEPTEGGGGGGTGGSGSGGDGGDSVPNGGN